MGAAVEMTEGAWVPEGLRARLQPGARVRIRISRECPLYWENKREGDCSQDFHWDVWDGATGTIIEPGGYAKSLYPHQVTPRLLDAAKGHDYLVLMDPAYQYRWNGALCTGMYCAAVELDPLEL